MLSLRFGVNSSEDPRTLDEIAGRKGVTRERIRQIEAKALGKLKERAAIMQRKEARM